MPAMTDDDLLGQPAAQAPAGMTDDDLLTPHARPSASDLDRVVRTAYMEGGNQPVEAQQAIVATIYNRAKNAGTSLSAQITPNAYSAWNNTQLTAKGNSLSPGDPAYEKILNEAVMPVITGQVKLPYTQYLNRSSTPPDSSALKTWAANPGVKIGDQEFYGPSENPPADPDVTNSATNAPLPDVQAKTLRGLQNTGDLVDAGNGNQTYKGMPIVVQEPGNNAVPQTPGTYWVDQSGKINQVPVDYDAGLSTINGALQGWGNKLGAGVQTLKATGGNWNNAFSNSTGYGSPYQQALDHYNQNQNAYGQEHPITAGLTSTGGSLATLVPAMAAGGELLAPVRTALGPVGDFLAGASKGNIFARGASLAANGAIQGGTAGAITSGESDKPFLDQVVTGALWGAALNPAISGTASGIMNAVNPSVNSDYANLANKAVNKYGIDLTWSQIKAAAAGGSSPVFTPNADDQLLRFTQVAGEQAGIPARASANGIRPGDGLLLTAEKDAGGKINDAASKLNITNTSDLVTNVKNIIADAKANNAPADVLKTLNTHLKNIQSAITPTGLPGKAYTTLIQTGSDLDKAADSDVSAVRQYSGRIKNALDNAIDAEGSPDVVQDLQNARLQYKNAKMLGAPNGPVANASVTGIFNPANYSRVVNRFNPDKARFGAGSAGELQDIGDNFLSNITSKPIKQTLGQKVLGTGLGALGGLGEVAFGLSTHDPITALKVAGATGAGLAAKGTYDALGNAFNNSTYVRDKLLSSVPYSPGIAGTTGNAFKVPLIVAATKKQGSK